MGSCNVASDLYELEGVDVTEVIFNGDKVNLSGRLKEERQSCPNCDSRVVIFIGKTYRSFHLPPTGFKKAKLNLLVRRHKCKNCNSTWWPKMPFADGKQRMSKSFVYHILDLMEIATIQDVARHLGVGWDTVKDLHKDHLRNKYKEVELKDVKYVSIDEISIAKGHKYMTIITDLKTGRVIHTTEGRAKEDIRPFLLDLKKSLKFESSSNGYV